MAASSGRSDARSDYSDLSNNLLVSLDNCTDVTTRIEDFGKMHKGVRIEL